MSRYAGKIKVFDCARMCWPVAPVTLEATGASCYDAYVWSDPELTPVETISEIEWSRRKRARESARGVTGP